MTARRDFVTASWPARPSPPPLIPPGPDARAYLLCYQVLPASSGYLVSAEVEKTAWADAGEAVEAALVQPCSSICVSEHVVVWSDPDGRAHARRITTHQLQELRRGPNNPYSQQRGETT